VNAIWSWLLYSLPWWAWGVIAVAIWVGLAVVVGVLFGMKYARLMLWPAIVAVLAVVMFFKARQDGYSDRKDEEQGAVDDAVQDFKQHEEAVDKKPIDQIDKENEKWLRP